MKDKVEHRDLGNSSMGDIKKSFSSQSFVLCCSFIYACRPVISRIRLAVQPITKRFSGRQEKLDQG